MNHSFYSVDRSTHLKIVVIALVVGIAVTSVALFSRPNLDAGSPQTAGIIKAGKPIAITSSGTSVTR